MLHNPYWALPSPRYGHVGHFLEVCRNLSLKQGMCCEATAVVGCAAVGESNSGRTSREIKK
jgi:hypothetical protein